MMNLYTIIVDFEEGNYTFQTYGSNEIEALYNWASGNLILQIKNIGPKSQSKFLEWLEYLPPVAVINCKNIWCFTISLNGKLALINIIKTIENLV